MKIKMPNDPSAWACPICGKFDFPDSDPPLAAPEHRPYRGIDLGTCPGEMISLYTKESILEANKEPK